MLLNIIIWILIGALVGWLAGRVMGVRKGLILTILVGIVGAFGGGWLARLVVNDLLSISITNNIVATIVYIAGAVVVACLIIVLLRAIGVIKKG